jgi:monofunctional biosynthetic peptidoglycan transglycosylase
MVFISAYSNSVYRSIPKLSHYNFSDLRKIAEQSLKPRFEDSVHLEEYRWTEIKDVSRDLIYTIVMSEDANFFEHDGFDFDAIATSLTEDLSKKKYEYGASTISQQVAKNLFLTQEKALIRKIKEAVVTRRLEHQLKKNQILEIYLNIAEFGPDIFGIDAASHRFFNKTPAEINAAEGAFLALMLPSPRKNYYAMFENENITSHKKKRLRRILGDMLVSELISPKQYKSYLNYNFFSQKPASHPNTGSSNATHSHRHPDRGLANEKTK